MPSSTVQEDQAPRMSTQDQIMELRQALVIMEQQLQVSRYAATTKVPPPKKFKGDKDELRTFLTGMEMYTRFNQATFSTDQDKILAAGNSMEGAAAKWFQPYMQDYLDSEPDISQAKFDTRRIFKSYTDFEDELKATFRTVDEENSAAAELRQLH